MADRHCQFPYEVLKLMMDDAGRATAYVSASGTDPLCARQDWLLDRESYYVNPERSYHAARGTMAHVWGQMIPRPGAVYEQRFEIPIEGFDVPFTGQLDTLILTGIGEDGTIYATIEDLKSKTDKKLPIHQANQNNTIQLNCYRYLVKYCWPQQPIATDRFGNPLLGNITLTPGTPAGIDVTKMTLNYFSMEKWVSFPAPIMSDDEVLRVIRKTMESRLSETAPAVPEGLDPHRSTFCKNWCPVRSACFMHQADEEGW